MSIFFLGYWTSLTKLLSPFGVRRHLSKRSGIGRCWIYHADSAHCGNGFIRYDGNLAIHDFETGENRDVTDEANWDKDWQYADASIWSPDSKQIAYFWLGPNEYSSLRTFTTLAKGTTCCGDIMA